MIEDIKKIIELIRKVKPWLAVVDESTILNEGALDSLDIITLVSLLEDMFHIKIDGVCLKQENFATAQSLYEMVQDIKKCDK